jgi:hypothetical protein
MEIPKFQIQKSQVCAISEIRKFVPTCFYRIRSAQQVPSESGWYIFFRNVTNSKKCKKSQKTKNAKNVPKTPNLGVLSKIGCGDLSKHWKSVENDTESPAHLCTLSKFREGHFQGFRDFNLESGKISEKGVFDVFWKKFSLLRFTGWRSTAHYMGRKSELRFFSKSAEHVFGFGSDLCCFTRENPSGRKWRRLQITIGPVAQGSVFLTLFCSDSGCEMASKKSERFCSTIIGYGEESM